MSRNIIVGLDGTWRNAASTTGVQTNIHAIVHSATPENQIKDYRPGVGAHLGWLGTRINGMTGKGVFQTARVAWQWIALNFIAGDRIFIFGFSREAFAARHLAGMIVRHGLHGWQGDIEQEFRGWLATVAMPIKSVRQEVHFLGLFDCVPGNQLYVARGRVVALNAPRLERGILHFRHAVCAASTTIAGSRQLFLPAKGQRRSVAR